MFYAIEHTHPYQFTRRELRDAWVEAGPGYREKLSARHPAIRKAHFVDDGDQLGWRVLAEQRIDGSAALRKYRAIISEDWSERDHWRWVATEQESAIVSWAAATETAADSVK